MINAFCFGLIAGLVLTVLLRIAYSRYCSNVGGMLVAFLVAHALVFLPGLYFTFQDMQSFRFMYISDNFRLTASYIIGCIIVSAACFMLPAYLRLLKLPE
jgi:hypothetical protein